MKNSSRVIMYVLFISLLVMMGGCLKGEQQTLKDPELVPLDEDEKETNDINDEENDRSDERDYDGEDDSEAEDEQRVSYETYDERTIYLIDADGMVVPQTLSLPSDGSKAVAKQVLTYLIKDGPVTELLPNGFQAVIPANTEILGLNLIDEGTLVVDVSDDFKNYEAQDELKIIQAITHTLTQFDNIDRIKLRINGVDQDDMPVNGTPISEGYSKNNGINLHIDEQPHLMYSKPVTMYYPKRTRDHLTYYVPMTQYVHHTGENFYGLIVQALMEGPAMQSRAFHVFNDQSKLLYPPQLNDDGVLQLVFNEHVLLEVEQAIIADDVMETLVRTLTNQDGVEAVEVIIDSKSVLNNEKGLAYDEPVTIQYFEQVKKM